MTDQPTKPPPHELARQNRLRSALRENLKRRKSQLRGRADQPEARSDAATEGIADESRGPTDPDRE
ncbi:MAG: hypothetical protein H7312_12180 [Tardiphaga sp.]|nr:hypothetical protein [Tardiphaga sp.]